MTQLDLTAWKADNAEHLERVSGKIAAEVLHFCAGRVRSVGQPENVLGAFHLEELTRWVRARIGIAPDSPGRILRMLRQAGQIRYEVLNRRKSLYRVDWVQS
jgi:hypothetical protein